MPAPRIQLALDCDLPRALEVLHQVVEQTDVIEAGTLLLLRRGVGVIELLRSVAGAGTPILADVRIAEAGGAIAGLAFGAGADIVTLLSSAGESTVRAVAAAAREHGGAVHIDLCSPYGEKELDLWVDAGIDHVVMSRSRDSDQSRWEDSFVEEYESLRGRGLRVTVTGGVSIADAGIWSERGADIVIVGRGVTGSGHPAAAIAEYREAMDGRGDG